MTVDLGARMRRRLAGFVRTLRDNEFTVGLAETRDALQILASPAARRASSLAPAMRALFCADRGDWERFDEIFAAYWLGRGMRRVRQVTGAAGQPRGPLHRLAGAPGAPGAPDHVERRHGGSEAAEGRGKRGGASRAETFAATDLRHISDPDDVAKAHALAARLARTMRARLVRRRRAHRRGRRLDLRRTIHRNISHGGTPVDLVWRRRKIRPLRLVILLDASGSMSLYTAFFVRFLHGVVEAFREAEAFLFHTRLVHVSASLRDRDVGRAVDRLSLMAQGIGGGTRIGESLATFNRWHARRVINSRTAVMIVSDGYDTGEPERLATEMARLRQRCRRIIWLNPLLGWDDYSPQARGMRAALAYVDLFAPAHNLASLAALEPYLARNLMTTTARDILDLVSGMKARGEPFALATVVRTVAATAAKAGAKAVIRPNGTISEGWIGGGYARAAVLKAAQAALADGKPRFVSVQPPDVLQEQGLRSGDEQAGVRFVRNMCPSEGTMDIFVEPVLPRPQLIVCGGSPVAVAIADLGRRLNFAVTVCAPAGEQEAFAEVDRRIEGFALPADEAGARFVVVSTQGRGDEAALQAALAVNAEYVAFVGSRKKAAALKAALAARGVAPDRLARLKAPAGLDLGAITPDEIALSILAEIVALRRRGAEAPLCVTPA